VDSSRHFVAVLSPEFLKAPSPRSSALWWHDEIHSMTDAKTQLLELLAVIPDGDKVGVEPRTVIAGHKRPGTKTVPRIIEETRQYIRDFKRLNEATVNARQLYADRVKSGLALGRSKHRQEAGIRT
jgi:hypothetical protein